MTVLDRDEQRFVAALHAHGVLADAGSGRPDLDRIAANAVRGGGTVRHRRQAAVGAAALAVACIGSTAVALGQGGPGSGHAIVPIAATGSAQVSASAHPSPDGRALERRLRRAREHDAAVARAARSAAALAAAMGTAYAVLDAPGWSVPQGPMDDKLYYVNGSESLSLNWRPAADFSPDFYGTTVIGHTTMAGQPAEIYSESGLTMVVGPVADGRFLTLTGSAGVTLDELATLATEVHRQQ